MAETLIRRYPDSAWKIVRKQAGAGCGLTLCGKATTLLPAEICRANN